MNTNIILAYKKLGETPLEVIRRYKQVYSLTNDTISFAGRLDPMAEGLLLLLRNDENKKRKDYEAYDKTYEFSFFVGVATDTYDLLGKITNITNDPLDLQFIEKKLSGLIASLPGEKIQAYPPYSSYHIRGKPLYYWARRGTLDLSSLPTKKIVIHSVKILSFIETFKQELQKNILQRLETIKGNFRQDEIRKLWEDELDKTTVDRFTVVTVRISCSSGTYIRGIVHSIGKELGSPTVTIAIKRTAIGPYTSEDTHVFH